MKSLAPLIESFFTDRLYRQLRASPNTVIAYRDTFRLLLVFAQSRLGKTPSDLLFDDLNAPFIGAFLTHLEEERHCSPRTRNSRLSAIHSFFRYAAFLEPAYGGLIQRVLAMPQTRCDRNLVDYLTRPEVEALLEAPDKTTWLGRRDYALLHLGIQTGMRVSELISLCSEQITFGTGSHIRCRGKGRKERCVPLTQKTSSVLRAWITEQACGPSEPVFRTYRGSALSRDACECLLTKYADKATQTCPSFKGKRVSPHVLRHTAAMQLLQSGVDCAVIALWLGHESIESTGIYLHADLSMKEKALARVTPIRATFHRYQPGGKLMAFLNAL